MNDFYSGGHLTFPIDPMNFASPYPSQPPYNLREKLSEFGEKLYDKDGNLGQRIVDVHQGIMDRLVSEYSSGAAIADPTNGIISGVTGQIVAGGVEQGSNLVYDTVLGGRRPRNGGAWYQVGSYGAAAIIFFATINAGNSKDASKLKTFVRNESGDIIGYWEQVDSVTLEPLTLQRRLQGNGQLAAFNRHQFPGHDIKDLLKMTTEQIELKVLNNEMSSKTWRTIKKFFEGRDLRHGK